MTAPLLSLPPGLQSLRVAIVHYWFVGRAGGERVVEELAALFPQADLFALIADRDQLAPELRTHHLETSFLQRLPLGRRFYRHTLPLQPLALEQFDLRDYDLVLSSESGPAKGVLTQASTCHVCYCHSPMRYLWDMYSEYRSKMNLPVRLLYSAAAHWLRQWDLASAYRVDDFVANSHFVANRIRKYYRRESTVIHPPVRVREATLATSPGEYYLAAGRLVDYKRFDLAIAACRHLGRKLLIAGDGPEYKALRRNAGSNAEFLGRLSDSNLAQCIAGCRALLFPGQEDFGILPVEVQAHGRPVIALGSGGALETVSGIQSGSSFSADAISAAATGVFFGQQSSPSLEQAILYFESLEPHFRAETIRKHAMQFDSGIFRERMIEHLDRTMNDWRLTNGLASSTNCISAMDRMCDSSVAPENTLTLSTGT